MQEAHHSHIRLVLILNNHLLLPLFPQRLELPHLERHTNSFLQNNRSKKKEKVMFWLRWAFSDLIISVSLKNFSPWATTVCSITSTGTLRLSVIDGSNEKQLVCLSNRVINHSGCPHFSHVLSDQNRSVTVSTLPIISPT